MYEIVSLTPTSAVAQFYAVRVVRSRDTLFESFLVREHRVATCSPEDRSLCLFHSGAGCRDECRRRERLQALVSRIENAVGYRGFHEGLFRDLGKYPVPCAALDASPFRVLGLRYDDAVFVAVDGGFKRGQRIQDDPALAHAWQLVGLAAQAIARAAGVRSPAIRPDVARRALDTGVRFSPSSP